MSNRTKILKEWLPPLSFLVCAGWVVWHGPAYILDFFPHQSESLTAQITELHKRKDLSPGLSGLFGGFTDVIDWLTLLLLPVIFVIGIRHTIPAAMEFDRPRAVDKFAIFVGRITMTMIISLTMVMLYEVFLRYIFQRPTLWANELTLWIAGFVFMFSGLYVMQQRAHIRIFVIYELFPRWLQKICDVTWVGLTLLLAFALSFGSYKQVFIVKFHRWEMLGTAFDPPIPATIQPMILIMTTLIALQAVSNLICDWNRSSDELIDKDIIDKEEIAAIKSSVE